MNSWWEDLEMSEELKECHEKMVTEMDLPQWLTIQCPFCEIQLTNRSIRSIQLLFNARNIGDIAIEFCCDECKKMDTLYLNKACKNIQDFCNVISGDKEIDITKSMIEKEMYKTNYNNLIEHMLLSQTNSKSIEKATFQINGEIS